MPPCTKAKKAPPAIPAMPVVSSKELEAARKVLESNEERKRVARLRPAHDYLHLPARRLSHTN